jgi:hypothetical protein
MSPKIGTKTKRLVIAVALLVEGVLVGLDALVDRLVRMQVVGLVAQLL